MGSLEGLRCGTTHHPGRKVGLTSQINEVLSASLDDVVHGRERGLWELRDASKYGYFNATWCGNTTTFFDCLFLSSCHNDTHVEELGEVTQFDALAAMAGALLRPSPALRDEIDEQRRLARWPDDKDKGSIVAVHLRRGDKYGDHSKGAKKHDYVSEIDDSVLADAIMNHVTAVGAAHIAISSDDPDVVHRIDVLLTSRNFSVVAFGPRSHTAGAALPFVATLFLLAEADAFVGNFDSNVSRLLALLIGARIALQPDCDARSDHGYPRILDLDGLLHPDDVHHGRYFCTLSRVTRRTAQLCHHADLRSASLLSPPLPQR